MTEPKFGDVYRNDGETTVMFVAPRKATNPDRLRDVIFGLHDRDTDNDWTGLIRNVNWTNSLPRLEANEDR